MGQLTMKSTLVLKLHLIPFYVVVGRCMAKEMDLNFQLLETATLFITVLVVAFMLQIIPFGMEFHHIVLQHCSTYLVRGSKYAFCISFNVSWIITNFMILFYNLLDVTVTCKSC